MVKDLARLVRNHEKPLVAGAFGRGGLIRRPAPMPGRRPVTLIAGGSPSEADEYREQVTSHRSNQYRPQVPAICQDGVSGGERKKLIPTAPFQAVRLIALKLDQGLFVTRAI